MGKKAIDISLRYYVKGRIHYDDGTEEEVEGEVVQFNENGAPYGLKLDGRGIMAISPPPPSKHDLVGLLAAMAGKRDEAGGDADPA